MAYIKHCVRGITYCTDEKVNEKIATGFCSYPGVYENIKRLVILNLEHELYFRAGPLHQMKPGVWIVG